MVEALGSEPLEEGVGVPAAAHAVDHLGTCLLYTSEYYSEASEVTAQMAASKKDAIAVLPQPYVTAAGLKDDTLRVALSLIHI